MSASTPDNTQHNWDDLKAGDRFGSWLGIQCLKIEPGYCKLQMTVRDEMVNPLGITHGGIVFSLADTAFGYACNAGNRQAVALDVSISFIKASKPGDTLIAETQQIHNGKSTGVYLITVTNQRNETVALFKGTCYNMVEGGRYKA